MITLVTGASGNLGKATVEKFLSENHEVVALTSPKGLGYQPKGKITAYETDLTNETNTDAVISKVISVHQKIDAALLLVGGYAGGDIAHTDSASVKKMLALNFDTAYHVARPVFQHMIAQGGGRIVFVSSRTSFVNNAGRHALAYSLSKSLVTRLAELLNAEGASKNVVSSVIAPGTIDTPDNRKAMPEADFSKWVAPEAIADVIHFLVTQPGQVLRDPIIKVYGRS